MREGSTSALDVESEKALELGLAHAVKECGVTVIAIAHRLRTIARTDVIFLLEAGQVVDQGSHQELMQRSGSYRINALHQMQGWVLSLVMRNQTRNQKGRA